MDKIMLPCGQRLKDLRREKGLKQKELAELLACTEQIGRAHV